MNFQLLNYTVAMEAAQNTVDNIRLICKDLLTEERGPDDFPKFIRTLRIIALMCVNIYNDRSINEKYFNEAHRNFVETRNEIYNHYGQSIPTDNMHYAQKNNFILFSLFKKYLEEKRTWNELMEPILIMSYLAMNASGLIHWDHINVMTYKINLAMDALPKL